MNAYPESLAHFCRRVATVGHLLDRRDLEFSLYRFPLMLTPFTWNYGSGVSSVAVAIQFARISSISTLMTSSSFLLQNTRVLTRLPITYNASRIVSW